MKKTLTILLASLLVIALAIPAFAVDSDPIKSVGGTATQDVQAQYNAAQTGEVATVYYVTVEWSVNSNITYSEGTTTYRWDAENTKYVVDTAAVPGWDGTATVDITVKNNSNAEITATADWKAAAGIEAACTYDHQSVNVDNAADGVEIAADEEGETKEATIKATVQKPTAGKITADNKTVGTITVTISAKQ